MGRIVNRSELAETFAVALSTVDLWLQGGMPFLARPERKGQSGWRIDLAAVLEWHRTRERESALSAIAGIDEQEARRRKLAAEAASAEFDLAKKEGSAVAIADFETAWSVMIGAARSRLLNLGAKLGPLAAISDDIAECEAMIDGGVREALQELSEFHYADIPFESQGNRESAKGDVRNLEAMGAASRLDGKRVGRRRETVEPGVRR